MRYRNAWLAYQRLQYFPESVDDLLSQGNGPVKIDQRLGAYFDTTSPRIGNWRYIFGANVFQQGVDGYSQSIELNATWYASERLTVRMIAQPQRATDWLLWEGGNLFGSYRTRRLDLDFRLDWIPSPRHELRLRWQWIGIDAEPNAAYRTGSGGELTRTEEPLLPFTLANLGLQLRYRFAIAPQSDFYVVYSRGGYRQELDDQRRVNELFEDMWGLRDADQVVVKLRYKL